jgi:hypothetical protein
MTGMKVQTMRESHVVTSESIIASLRDAWVVVGFVNQTINGLAKIISSLWDEHSLREFQEGRVATN